MGFNSGFKGLIKRKTYVYCENIKQGLWI